MMLSEVSSLARKMMNEHGLGHIPFEFDRGRRRIGCCHYVKNLYNDDITVSKITISHHYATLLPQAEIEQIILHEIAHAKAGYNNNHNHIWKAIARSIGATGDRCHIPSDRPDAAWIGECRNGHTISMHRAPGRVRSCGKCGGGKFNFDYVYTWRQNGKIIPSDRMPAKYRAEYNSMVIRNTHTKNIPGLSR